MRPVQRVFVCLCLAMACACLCARAETWRVCANGRALAVFSEETLEEGFSPVNAPIALGVGESVAIDAPAAQSPTFASSNVETAEVDADGAVRALSPGKAVIRAFLLDGAHADVTVVVKKAPESIRLSAKEGVMKLGEEYQLKYTLSKASAGEVAWDSSDEGVVSVSESGLLSARGLGQCVISAETYNGLTAECAVRVEMPAPAKVRLNAYKGQMYAGETYRLVCTLEGGYQETVTWFSNNEPVLTVDDTGLLTAVSPGTAIVRVQASEGNYTNCVVNVLPGSTEIAADAHALVLYAGGSAQLTARAVGGSGKYALVSMNPDIAAIDAETGRILAVSPGAAEVRAVAPSGVYDGCAVTVLSAPNPFEISAEANVVAQTETLRTSFLAGSSNELPVKYESDAPDVALVNAEGLILGVKPGTAVIRAEAGGRAAEFPVEVRPMAEGIRLSAESGELGVGDAYTLDYALTGGAGTVTFSSSDSAVVSVDAATGRITAAALGEAKITAALSNGVRAVCAVRVTPAPAKLALEFAEITIGAGDGARVAYTIDDGANGSVAWSSGDEALLTVDGNGAIASTGALGTAAITARTHNLLEASVQVNVIEAPERMSVNAEALLPGGTFDAYILLKAGETRALGAVCEGYTHVTFAYESTQAGVAAVNAAGVITALSEGTTLVTARAYTGMETRVLVEVQK